MHFVIAALFVFFAAVHGGYEKTPYQAGTPSFWNGAIGHSWLLFFHPMQWASALLNVAFLAVLLGTDWASRLSPR